MLRSSYWHFFTFLCLTQSYLEGNEIEEHNRTFCDHFFWFFSLRSLFITNVRLSLHDKTYAYELYCIVLYLDLSEITTINWWVLLSLQMAKPLLWEMVHIVDHRWRSPLIQKEELPRLWSREGGGNLFILSHFCFSIHSPLLFCVQTSRHLGVCPKIQM